MQSFVLDPAENPFNVVEPGKQPRVTLTPTLALKDGRPYLAFAVQGGDSQDQNLLQFFLNMVEFGMNVQQAAEARTSNSYQMQSSFGAHESEPGRLLVCADTPPWVQAELRRMGYRVETAAAPPARSTPSSSTTSTAPCGAARATSARTTGGAGATRPAADARTPRPRRLAARSRVP
jgi:gamma-glutamyltranspeptidase